MGLTLHFTLSGQGERAGVDLLALRNRCLDLPFMAVGDIEDTTDDAILSCHSQLTLERWGGGTEDPGRIAHSMGFVALPGEGCEPMCLGWVRPEGSGDWHWHSFCKTQYAGDSEFGGLENFLRCHLSVVAVLDAARDLGLLIDVVDEGGYWTHRDVRKLEQVLTNYNSMIAASAGTLRDGGLSIQAPIFERPDFEPLEAEGIQRWPQHIRDLISLTRGSAENLENRPREH